MAPEEQDEIRRERLSNTRSLEDQYRDDQTAIAYMLSKEFGRGIDVMPGSNTARERVTPEDDEKDAKAPAAPDLGQSTQIVTHSLDEGLGEIQPDSFQSQDVSVDPPPRESPPSLSSELELGYGGIAELAGGGVPESPSPVTPNILPQIDDALTTPLFVPEEGGIVPEGFSSQPLPPLGEQIPVQPEPIIEVSSPVDLPPPAPAPVDETLNPNIKEMPEVLNPLPFLPPPPSDNNIEPPYFRDEIQKDQDGSGPLSHAIQGMDRYADSQAKYLEHVGNLFFGMSDRLDEAIKRIRELEAALDRRYQRRFK